MPVTGGQQTAFFQDGGVGHGAFVATFNTAGFVELEDFSPEFPSKIIAQGNHIGAPLKQCGVQEFQNASCVAQIPVDNTGNNPTFILLGDYFTAPNNYGGGRWWVAEVGDTFRAGEYWKANVKLRLAVNG